MPTHQMSVYVNEHLPHPNQRLERATGHTKQIAAAKYPLHEWKQK